MNQLPENSLRIYNVTFSNIIFNRINETDDFCTAMNVILVLLGLFAH